jgi:hypothetical protein
MEKKMNEDENRRNRQYEALPEFCDALERFSKALNSKPRNHTASDAFIVYRCDRIQLGQSPQNEVELCRTATFYDAAQIADSMSHCDRCHSYIVGRI